MDFQAQQASQVHPDVRGWKENLPVKLVHEYVDWSLRARPMVCSGSLQAYVAMQGVPHY